MSREMGRDDFVISARSVFLNKGNRQKFSLLTLLLISIVVLSLEYFKSGPVNQIRMITKDIVIKSSYVASVPFKSISKTYSTVIDHFKMYDEYEKLKTVEIKKQKLILENNFFKEENHKLKKLLNETDAYLGMYHDQVLPVIKALSFGSTTNVTLGVPIIRTSVDHGVALDIAGAAESDTSSLKEAIKIAKKIV